MLYKWRDTLAYVPCISLLEYRFQTACKSDALETSLLPASQPFHVDHKLPPCIICKKCVATVWAPSQRSAGVAPNRLKRCVCKLSTAKPVATRKKLRDLVHGNVGSISTFLFAQKSQKAKTFAHMFLFAQVLIYLGTQ